MTALIPQSGVTIVMANSGCSGNTALQDGGLAQVAVNTTLSLVNVSILGSRADRGGVRSSSEQKNLIHALLRWIAACTRGARRLACLVTSASAETQDRSSAFRPHPSEPVCFFFRAGACD